MPTATASISVEDAVKRRRGDLVELSHAIHAEPELAFAEHRSCAKTQALVAERGFEITAAPGGLGHRVSRRLRQRSAGHRHLRRVRRAARDRTCLRAQHHRRVGGRHRAGAGRGGRRAGPDGGAARHARRGGGRRKSVAAQGRNVRRHRRDGDAAPRADRHRRARARWRCRRSRSATSAARRTPRSRRISGVNAADAITVAQVAIGLLRQQLAPGQMVHGIVTDGGQATNVIPGARRDAVHDARQRLRVAARARGAGWPAASPPVRSPPAASTRSPRPRPPTPS